jgi:hypothetical protein
MAASTPVPALALAVPPLTAYHRGFALALIEQAGRPGAGSYGFEIRHHGLPLHTSSATFGSAASAERAARRFIDDALGAFDHAYRRAEVTV